MLGVGTIFESTLAGYVPLVSMAVVHCVRDAVIQVMHTHPIAHVSQGGIDMQMVGTVYLLIDHRHHQPCRRSCCETVGAMQTSPLVLDSSGA